MNAYDVADTLRGLGVDVGALGCVLLDVEAPSVDLPGNWAYVSDDPTLKHVDGLKTSRAVHVTLLYGLLRNAHQIRHAVDQVLDGWTPESQVVERVSHFPGAKGLPYSCIIGKLAVTPNLADAHARLSLLPHIDTHPQYTPHVTLGYVRSEHTDAALEALASWGGRRLRAVALNYGRTVS